MSLLSARARVFAVAFVLAAGSSWADAQRVAAEIDAARDTITADGLKKNLTFIASDDLQGRATPSLGQKKAAEYIAQEFAAAGLKPAASLKGWFLEKPIKTFRWRTEAATASLGGATARPLTVGAEVEVVVRDNGAAIDLKALPLVAIGAERLLAFKGDDAAASPLVGKGVVVAVGTLGGSRDEVAKCVTAAFVAGAKACVLVMAGATVPDGYAAWYRAGGQALRSVREPRGRDKADQNASAPRVPFPQVAVFDAAAAAALFDGMKVDLAALRADRNHAATPLVGRTLDLKVPTDGEQDDALREVIGMLPGSSPEKAGEAIIFTAHYDHIGISRTAPKDGDWIFNGADDDGAGTVSLMALARAFASLKPGPKRTVIFCANFGEEDQMQGSQWYVAHPVHPLDKTICDINIEMIGRSFDVGPKTAWVTGWDYSNLGELLAIGGRAAGVTIKPDPYPTEHYFMRSDNVQFVKKGIPGHSISAGSKHPDYHGLKDEVDRIEFPNMEAIVRGIFLGSLPIADGTATVTWKKKPPRG